MRATSSSGGLRRTVFATGVAVALLALSIGGSAPADAASNLTTEPVATTEPVEPAETTTPEEPAPAEPGAPQLSITVSDEKDAVSAGDELAYSITIVNLGTSDAFDLTVTQTVPEGLEFTSADSGGTLTSSTVGWTVTVKAAETATLKTTMTAGDTPADLLRLATVACAASVPTEPPIVCASDSNILPAGIAAEKAAAAPAQRDGDRTPWIVGASVGAALLIAASAFILNRRRRARRAAPPEGRRRGVPKGGRG
ncbi:hypothetical protein [Agreia sp.]|uniref:hypothetical protein n=1 Tax=Agreia sp. TaxID=1872416 RepID=UPI0035BC1E44